MRKTFLPDSITLPCGAILKSVHGGHIGATPFLTKEHSGVDVTQNGWAMSLLDKDPCIERAINKLVVSEAKRRKLKYRKVSVLSRNLLGKFDLHRRPYTANVYVFVEVKGGTHA